MKPPFRILVPVDFSEQSRAMLRIQPVLNCFERHGMSWLKPPRS